MAFSFVEEAFPTLRDQVKNSVKWKDLSVMLKAQLAEALEAAMLCYGIRLQREAILNKDCTKKVGFRMGKSRGRWSICAAMVEVHHHGVTTILHPFSADEEVLRQRAEPCPQAERRRADGVDGCLHEGRSKPHVREGQE